MNVTRTLDAESETLSLTDVKTQLRITDSNSDDDLRAFIAEIRHQTEDYLRKTLVTSTWEMKLDCFLDEIKLRMDPVQSISSVQYIDDDGVTQTLASSGYQFDKSGRLKPSYGNSWPSTRAVFDAVTIIYVAGEMHAGNVKPSIKRAMKLWIGECEVNRENVAFTQVVKIPNSAENILSPQRTWRV